MLNAWPILVSLLDRILDMRVFRGELEVDPGPGIGKNGRLSRFSDDSEAT